MSDEIEKNGLLLAVKNFIMTDTDLQKMPTEAKRAYITIMMYIAMHMVGDWGAKLILAFDLNAGSGDTIIKQTAYILSDRTDAEIRATLALLLAE